MSTTRSVPLDSTQTSPNLLQQDIGKEHSENGEDEGGESGER